MDCLESVATKEINALKPPGTLRKEGHLCIEVFPSQRKLGTNIPFINRVRPATNRYNSIQNDAHPPSTSSGFEITKIPGRRQVSSRQSVSMGGKCSRVVQAQGNGYTCLKSSEHPYFYPPTFLIEIPRKDNTCLNDLKNVLPSGHCPVDVLASLAHMVIREPILPGTVGLQCYVSG